jgi:hypothetical protein
VAVFRPGGVDTEMQAWIRSQDPARVGAALHQRFIENHRQGTLLTPEQSAASSYPAWPASRPGRSGTPPTPSHDPPSPSTERSPLVGRDPEGLLNPGDIFPMVVLSQTWTASIFWHIEELVIIVDSGRTGGRLATDEIVGTGPRSSGRASDLSGRVSRRREQNQLHPLRWISPETRSSSYYQTPMTRPWLLPMTTLGQRAWVSRWLLRWLGPCW